MPQIVLPAKYYISHFHELIDFLEEYYPPVFAPAHAAFLRDFRALPEDAQCAFVRMINRKGRLFRGADFAKYAEIVDVEAALAELRREGFARPVAPADKPEVIGYLTKPQLRAWLRKAGIPSPVSAAREELEQAARAVHARLDLADVPVAGDLLVQEKTEELRYLLFLFFGTITDSLTLYTLRDLGVRKAGGLRTDFKPRYTRLEHARADYFFAGARERLAEGVDDPRAFLRECLAVENPPASARALRERLLLELAAQVAATDADLALEALAQGREHPARETRARLLYKLGRKDECRAELEKILADPVCDEELLFAEDYFARKFDQRRVGYLTAALREAHEITLSDFYLKRPESGVRDLFRERGLRAHFTENHLWTGLFGLLFWEELFNREDVAIHNPFERSPRDLVGPEFYERHAAAIEEKLALLHDLPAAERHVLRMVSENYGKLNDIFQWRPNVVGIVLDFLRVSGDRDVAHVLRALARRFDGTGFPDLMVEDAAGPRFIEVKAEGDAVRAGQLSKARLLKEAGFDVEILKVRWRSDPRRVYVVVDVETTGSSAGFHRITEIGAVKLQGGEIVDEFQTLINPGRPIPWHITRITGITNEMVAGAPAFAEIAERFQEFTANAVFVAHNVRFDYGFIQREFARLDQEFVRPQLCTVLGMRRSFPGISSYGLKHLTEHFGIGLQQHHRALHDARAAAELLRLINEKRTSSQNRGAVVVPAPV